MPPKAAPRKSTSTSTSATKKRARPTPTPSPSASASPSPPPSPSNHHLTAPSPILLGQSRRQGHCIQSGLFYNSTSWVPVLRRDVDELFEAFENEEGSSGGVDKGKGMKANGVGKGKGKERSKGEEEGEDEEEGRSPFEVFKGVWERLGWTMIHSLGCLDAPGRDPWANSILRAFLSHLRPDEDPLKQLTAIFAVYTFWATQPKTPERFFVNVDSVTLHHILSLPSTLPPLLGASADSSSSHTVNTSDPLLLDLTQVLFNLSSQNAFIVVPPQTYLFPRDIPCVDIRDAGEKRRKEVGMRLVGVEEEMEGMRRSELRYGLLGEGGDGGEEGEGDGEGEGEREEDEEEALMWDSSKGWLSTLPLTQTSYLSLKETTFPTETRSALRKFIEATAEDLTLQALKDARQVAEGVVPGIATIGEGSDGARGLNLFGLVGEMGEEREAEGEGEGGGEGKGLKVYEKLLDKLGKADVGVEVDLGLDGES